jgi:hypothetical protein
LGVASDVGHTEVLVPAPLVPALEACHGPSEYSVVSDDESEAGRPYEPDSPPTPKGGGGRFVPSDLDLDGPSILNLIFGAHPLGLDPWV